MSDVVTASDEVGQHLLVDRGGLPVGQPACIKDWFGLRRSFNGSDYDYFHSGADYGICSQDHPFDIYAAASGTVMNPLPVKPSMMATPSRPARWS